MKECFMESNDLKIIANSFWYYLSGFMFHSYLIIGTDDQRNIFYIFIFANISHFSLIILTDNKRKI